MFGLRWNPGNRKPRTDLDENPRFCLPKGERAALRFSTDPTSEPVMPNESMRDLGLQQVLLERLNAHILPRALGLRAKVDRGECLSDYELQMLDALLEDATSNTKLAKNHRELHLLCGRMASLYREITRKALENEEQRGKA
jgi:hypothetical protein